MKFTINYAKKEEPFVELKIPKNRFGKIVYNQIYRQNYKHSFFQSAFDFLYSNNIEGDYFEFGIHKARTFRFALYESYVQDLKMDFYAFDSFEGLPNSKNFEMQNKLFKPKLLKTNVNQFKIHYEPWHVCGSSGKSFLLYKKK